MKKSFFIVLMLTVALVMIGCGQKGESTADSTEEAAVEKVADVENTVSFSSEEIGGEGFTLNFIEAKKHTMQTGDKKYSALIIILANYDSGGGSWHPSPKEDGHIRITVNFSAPAGEELKAGVYNIAGTMAESNYLSIGIEGMVDGASKSIGLLNGEGTGEITHIDDKTISGKIDLKDSQGTTIKATFTTPYSKSAF